MDSITIKAPAKVNLFLQVLGGRADGYTEIRTLMQAVSLYDEVTVERAESGLTISASDPAVPLDESNTVARAWAALCQVTGYKLGARIHIGKKIPAESGLGGGSSDAAAALVGLSKIYDLSIERSTIEALGSVVGSDVPFFFGSGSSLAEGRGERITDIDITLDYAILLVRPPYGMRTEKVYSMTKKSLTTDTRNVSISVLNETGNPVELCLLGNALEAAFLTAHPGAKAIEKELLEAGASYAALSGSGSAFFGIFVDPETAEASRTRFDKFWTAAVRPIRIGFFG